MSLLSDQEGFAIAVEEAKIGYEEGGVPIGAALKGSAIHHGETSALENSGRLPASAYKGSTILSPCDMWYVLSTNIQTPGSANHGSLGENNTFLGGEAYLKQRGIEVINMESKECQELMEKFISEKPELWNEDIGVEKRVYTKE
ncbi:hypothetical protein EYC84_002755 [Monilinia fructicola]|uniref:Uncharacterized protein n=1 Tax=Monilinia fructicola TaxID=38448 RepID=A0A5M9JMJ9_MONFR|nr:hypothetical protein EYC84_002755 [Monilinia fructicola]